MQLKTVKTIYKRPPVRTQNAIGKNRVNTVSMLSNELHRLENEKKIVELKINSVENKIHEVQNEIDSIGTDLKDAKEYLEGSRTSTKVKHVTLEY